MCLISNLNLFLSLFQWRFIKSSLSRFPSWLSTHWFKTSRWTTWSSDQSLWTNTRRRCIRGSYHRICHLYPFIRTRFGSQTPWNISWWQDRAIHRCQTITHQGTRRRKIIGSNCTKNGDYSFHGGKVLSMLFVGIILDLVFGFTHFAAWGNTFHYFNMLHIIDVTPMVGWI